MYADIFAEHCVTFMVVGIENISVDRYMNLNLNLDLNQVGGATSWRLAGLVPPVVSCVAIPILIIMKVVQLFWFSCLFLVLLGVSSFLGEETKRGASCFEMVQTGGRGRCQVTISKILISKS